MSTPPRHSSSPIFVTDSTTREPLAADWFDQATALCSAGDYTHAMALAAAALKTGLALPLRVQTLNLCALSALGLNRLHEAETCWRACIAAQPAFVEAYSNLGALLVSTKRLDDAHAIYTQWLENAPGDADALHALAQALRERKQLAEALRLAHEALAARPDDTEIRFGLAMTLHDHGKLAEAEHAYRAVLERHPDHRGVPYRLGNVLKDLGRYPEAIGAYQQALAIDPRDANALRQLGDALRGAGHLPEAEKACLLALAIRPDDPETLNALAAALCALQRFPEAEAACRRAIAIRPAFAEAQFNLGIILSALGRREEAAAAYQRARQGRPDVVEIHNNLGCVLRDLDRLDEAADVFAEALKVRPGFAQAAYNLGNVLKALGRFGEAEAAYRRAIDIRGGYPEARFALATLLLSLERFEEAWPLYESRYEHPEFVHHATRSLLRCAHWQGESLEGKSLLVWQEDGLGDMLHFGRYFALLKARGPSRIVFACMPALRRLFERVEAIDSVVDHQSALAEAAGFDYWTSPLSAPLHLHTTFDARAPGKYLHAAPELVDAWRARLAVPRDVSPSAGASADTSVESFVESFESFKSAMSHTGVHPAGSASAFPEGSSEGSSAESSAGSSTGSSLAPSMEPSTDASAAATPTASGRSAGEASIGLVWKGNPKHHNDAHRSLPSLATLAPLWAVPGLRFVSLQKGAGEADVDSVVDPATGSTLTLPMTSVSAQIADLADTAAIIAQLDLVICVDTSVAHLAASMGKPCWILLPERDVDWRWLHGRDDSPWYPDTVRLFRRSSGETWANVVERVRQACQVRFATSVRMS
ncbi:Tetratricopeptide repeat protein [Pararobbsia alpina]